MTSILVFTFDLRGLIGQALMNRDLSLCVKVRDVVVTEVHHLVSSEELLSQVAG